MKVVLLNTFETNGGAAIACNRLTSALRKNGIDVRMLVCEFTKTIHKIRFGWERFVIWINNRFSKENLFAVSIANTGSRMHQNALIKEADIIHIHWINQGFLSLNSIRELASLGKPIVWTMHDQWPYTGICHYTSGCHRFAESCGFCPKLKNPRKRDLSYRVFEKKKKLYQSEKITLVGCSRWIAEEARKSGLCHGINIRSIPNPIDTTIYNKRNKTEARERFNLPPDKRFILFGACKVTDERKGFRYMKEACDLLYREMPEDKLAIVVFGGKTEQIESLLPYNIHTIGYVSDTDTMVNLYNAVDLFLIPSLEDNLPNTIMEAMACGTPCVGFDTGGIPEMIEHKRNGYVADYKNAEDLAEGISWVLSEADYHELSANARRKVVENYSENVVAEQYLKLYNSLLN